MAIIMPKTNIYRYWVPCITIEKAVPFSAEWPKTLKVKMQKYSYTPILPGLAGIIEDIDKTVNTNEARTRLSSKPKALKPNQTVITEENQQTAEESIIFISRLKSFIVDKPSINL